MRFMIVQNNPFFGGKVPRSRTHAGHSGTGSKRLKKMPGPFEEIIADI
jgi:hypothetical protein